MSANHDSYGETDADQLGRLASRHRPRLRRATTATMALLGLVLVLAACGGSKSPAGAGGGSSSAELAKFEAYARCMRSHGISDFPDPTTSGGVGITLNGGRGSDLDPNDPRFKTANRACQSLAPSAHAAPAPSAQKIAAEVKWARCMRARGLPNFPDPNGRGAFDSSKFDENSPAFQFASKACQSLENDLGAVSAVPGHGR
jgi:hypothetical protein